MRNIVNPKNIKETMLDRASGPSSLLCRFSQWVILPGSMLFVTGRENRKPQSGLWIGSFAATEGRDGYSVNYIGVYPPWAGGGGSELGTLLCLLVLCCGRVVLRGGVQDSHWLCLCMFSLAMCGI